MTLNVNQITDVTNSTLRELGRNRIQQIAQAYPSYPACNYFFRKEKEGRMMLDDGYEIQRSLWVKKSNTASSTGLYEADDVNVENLTAVAQIPWRYYKSYWVWDTREVSVNSGPSRIFNFLKVRQDNAHLAMVELLSSHIWTLPAASNTRDLYGIPYYVVKNATAGFNGGHPSGYSSVANVSRTTYPSWKNYTAQYVNVSFSDLIDKLRTSFRAMRWQDVEGLSVEDYRRGRDKYVLFVNNATAGSLENLVEGRNENLRAEAGPYEASGDIYRFDGSVTFRRKPIVFEPFLDGDSTNPVYALDLSTWCMYVKRGENMRRSDPEKFGDNHNVFATWYDLTCNLMCFDPRRNGVFYV